MLDKWLTEFTLFLAHSALLLVTLQGLLHLKLHPPLTYASRCLAGSRRSTVFSMLTLTGVPRKNLPNRTEPLLQLWIHFHSSRKYFGLTAGTLPSLKEHWLRGSWVHRGFECRIQKSHEFKSWLLWHEDMKTEFAALVCLQTINSSNNQPAGWFINWWIVMFYGKQLFLSELKIMHLNVLFVASTASYALTTHHRHNTDCSLCIFRHTWCVVASFGQ